MSHIRIKGARTHNLKNISLDIPHQKIIVITGLSGSGKSSLAFDTIYAEGQRRFVQSLSAYARQFLSMMEKPDVDAIEGLAPAISIEQKTISHNPRSTVGTITEVMDYLRLLYARVGTAYCPTHQTQLVAQPIDEIVDHILKTTDQKNTMILAPIVKGQKGSHQSTIQTMQAKGFIRMRINKVVHLISDCPELDPNKIHHLDVVIDRLLIQTDARSRITHAVETATSLSDGMVQIVDMDLPSNEQTFSTRFSCHECQYSVDILTPQMFSFNSPKGACPSCDGLGHEEQIDPNKVIYEDRTIRQGALRGYDESKTAFFIKIEALAHTYEFSLDQTFHQLRPSIQQILLYGTKSNIQPRFKGIIPMLDNHYRRTDSQLVRKRLSRYLSYLPCQGCQGNRLNEAARHVKIQDQSLPQLINQSLLELKSWFQHLKLPKQQQCIAQPIRQEIQTRLDFLCDVGLNYLSLNRPAHTLSGGESQRIRLASQIGSGLIGILYVLDEPSIGLHARDHAKLLEMLNKLKALGNTVIVVEHDEATMRAADHIIDIGPGAGSHGGKVIAQGDITTITNHPTSLTGAYLSGKKTIPMPTSKSPPHDLKIHIRDACTNNLKNIAVQIPLGQMTLLTGVSGSGKSTLMHQVLHPYVKNALMRKNIDPDASTSTTDAVNHLKHLMVINQSPIGRTPRSNPATYTGMFTPIRELFAGTEEARMRGYSISRFSFNVAGGRCDACDGDGVIQVNMHFLSDIHVTCETCQGKRFNQETLDVTYKDKSIADILNMTVSEAKSFFKSVPTIHKRCQTLEAVGLGYITLGQSATTLSGGEAQRIKLSKELSGNREGKTLYLLDEPSTGLHIQDIKQLLQVLFELRDRGNTLVIIEHHLDIIKCADWNIDLGPEGGNGGGNLVHQGTIKSLLTCKKSHTARCLFEHLS
ncbi:excinuclease ABC subunit UvrA [Gammaproteobacteria bacterium]|nr:excinuclease ABC subunit UvrA [Gammaproteobacteria bacterium]